MELTLPEGSSLQAADKEAQRFAAVIGDDANIESYSYYVGQGAPRFVLTLDPVLPSNNYAQFVIVAKDVTARNQLHAKLEQLFANEFGNIRGNIKLIQTGPPSAYPVMIRVSGYEHDRVRDIAGQVSGVMANSPSLYGINYDWNEKVKTMHLTVDPDKARLLGIDRNTLAQALQTQLSGASIAEFREQDKTVDIVLRLNAGDRKDLSQIQSMPIHIGSGKFVPLEQIAQIGFEAEDGLVWRRDLKPTITVQANVVPGVTGYDATKQVYDSLASLRKNLPPGY